MDTFKNTLGLLLWNTLRYMVCLCACYRTVCVQYIITVFYSSFPQDNAVQQQIIDSTLFLLSSDPRNSALGREPRVPHRGIWMTPEIELIWKKKIH